jgi:hypothetical protein
MRRTPSWPERAKIAAHTAPIDTPAERDRARRRSVP